MRRGEDTDPEGLRPCEDKGSGWSDLFVSQGMPKLASSHQKLGDLWYGLFPRDSRSLLTPRFGIPGLQNYEILNFYKPPNL